VAQGNRPNASRGAPGQPGLLVPLLATVLALVALPAAAAGSDRAVPDSGVYGLVRAEGVCSAPIDPKCLARAPSIEVRRPGEEVVIADVRPGPLGRFRVRLRPGRYVLVLRAAGAARAMIARRVVRVNPHKFTFVVLGRESRIR
jgi:hypothetical protein